MSESFSGKKTRPVTMKNISEKCGVSPSTVSRVLSGTSLHSDEMECRIRAVAKEMGYDPTFYQSARRMACSRHGKPVSNRVIALVMASDFHRIPFLTRIFQGIYDVLNQAGYNTLLVNMATATDESLPADFSVGDVDGIIVYQSSLHLHSIRTKLQDIPSLAHCPLVSIMSSEPGCRMVTADLRLGAGKALGHLLDLGHRHFLTFTPSHLQQPMKTLEQMALGHAQAFRDRGLDPAPYLHTVSFSSQCWDYTFTHAHQQSDDPAAFARDAIQDRQALAAILSDHPEVTAVLAPNDRFAQVVYSMLIAFGRRIPEDISLVGFDDTDSPVDSPGRHPLTTVHVPLEEIGQAAARLVLDPSGESIILPTHLVIRGTTAPVAGATAVQAQSM